MMPNKGFAALMAAGVAATSMVVLAPEAAAADRTCRSKLTGIVVSGNVNVPAGATCTLTNVTVRGDVKLQRGATLLATDGRVVGSIQGEDAPKTIQIHRTRIDGNVQTKNASGTVVMYHVRVAGSVQAERNRGELKLYGARITGNVQTKYMASRVDSSVIGGDFQHEEGLNGRLVRTSVKGDVQFFSNRGEQRISLNTIGGNLQCKQNSPAPVGSSNTVMGSKEGQCRGL